MLGYAISAMIQAFVPKASLTKRMGGEGPRDVGLATAFGAISSSCSFAALATARSLVAKGASIVAGVAFMFASTNLVIELGILVFIFLGWPYLLAELIGGVVLIGISTTLVRLTAPDALRAAMRSQAEEDAPDEPDDFDWRQRMRSAAGWRLVGHQFVMEWKMVWEEIALGFTVAGFIAVLVPDAFWKVLFLSGVEGVPGWLVSIENAVVGPLVAACTFIGSMGNIPLATVLASSGAAFAGVMAFIYSDLMVPPLVRVNARYFGWRGALYVAGVMFVSIVATALLLDASVSLLDLEPGAGRGEAVGGRFALDYTFFMNLGFVAVAGAMVWLHHRHVGAQDDGGGRGDEEGGGLGPKRWLVYGCFALVGGGLVVEGLKAAGVLGG